METWDQAHEVLLPLLAKAGIKEKDFKTDSAGQDGTRKLFLDFEYKGKHWIVSVCPLKKYYWVERGEIGDNTYDIIAQRMPFDRAAAELKKAI